MNTDEAQQAKTSSERAEKESKGFVFLVGAGVSIAIAAVVNHIRSSQLENLLLAAQRMPQATVSVVHPERPGLVTLEVLGQLSAYTEALIYA